MKLTVDALSNWYIFSNMTVFLVVVGGTISAIQGNGFARGAAAAGVSKGFYEAGLSFADDNVIFNALEAGVIGGTTSRIMGGNFAQGAKLAAYARLFNDMLINIHRLHATANSTLGYGTIDGEEGSFYLLEPGGPDSTIDGSNRRIPEGEYDLLPYVSKKYPFKDGRYSAYMVMDVKGRSLILLHSGSFEFHTTGCGLPGQRPYLRNGDWALGGGTSRLTRNSIFDKIASEPTRIRFTNDRTMQ